MRQPTCIYLSVSKHADTNEGVTEFACSKYNIKWLSFNVATDTTAGMFSESGINTKCFDECQRCEFNTRI